MNLKNVDWKLVGIITSVVVAVFVLLLFIANAPKNKAISLEEEISQAQADITIVEKKRNELLPSLAKCVEKYDEHEYETLMAIINARGNNTDKTVNEVNEIISVIAEAYPELKSNEQYKSLMESIELNENNVARYRENFNTLVTKYNSHVRKFPNSFLLSLVGYQAETYNKLSYEVEETLPTLFED